MLQCAENAESPTTIHTAPELDSSPKIAESPSGNSPVIPDGYVMVPIDMTAEQMREVQINSELGAYAAANLTGAYSLFREFWDAAVTAAPKQVVNNPDLADQFKILDFGQINILKSDDTPTMKLLLSDFRIISEYGLNNKAMLLSILDYVKEQISNPRCITYVDSFRNIVLPPRELPAAPQQEVK